MKEKLRKAEDLQKTEAQIGQMNMDNEIYFVAQRKLEAKAKK